ncbi:hypothetical protein KRR38_17135 [Novosphingobium sp. G106]|uniref:hypothetical protein n=1 Tax=Novosphingobium sp. G106 TaxID=2849500 RepID=UPI001C2DB0EC|nr:hypothetical protein [Novosphingobium sp. G106]MBV1689348.1 hypothetical protein [Novosphingobium sp. G106]
MSSEADEGNASIGAPTPEHARAPDTVKIMIVFSIGLAIDFVLGSIFTIDPINFQQFWYQDIWLIAAILFLALLSVIGNKAQGSTRSLTTIDVRLMSLAIFTICYLGHRWLLLSYDLSRDEQMANFDATIFAHGFLAWPLPPEWRANAGPLNLLFISPGVKGAWVSAYLPMNAALRAVMGWFGGRDLTAPRV